VFSPLEFFHKNMSQEQLLFTWSTFCDSSMGTKLKLFLKNLWNCEVCLNFFTKTCLTNNYFSCDPHYVILAWVQSWNISEKLIKVCSPLEFFHKNMCHKQLPLTWSTFRHSSMGTIFLKNSWNCEVRLNFFTKTCLPNNYFSCDPHFVILAWVQSWNIFEKLMKLWSSPEFFHKNMSHQQLPFMWCTLRDSSMGTKLKYFWKTHETIMFAWIFSQKHVSRTITFHVINISWF